MSCRRLEFDLKSKLLRQSLMFLGSCLLPNIIFFLVARLLGVERPLLNIDYAVVAVVFAFGWWRLALVFSVFFLVVDFLALFGQVMPFVRFGDIFYLLSFALVASYYHLALLFFVVALLSILGWGMYVTGRRLDLLVALCFLSLMALVSVLQPASSGGGLERFYRFSSSWWVKSQTQLLFRARGDLFLALFSDDGLSLLPLKSSSASVPFWSLLGSEVRAERMMLVVAESWGQSIDPRVRDKLLEPLTVLSGRRLEQGEVKPTGMTLAGELRELCHLVPTHYNLKPVEKGFERCLPNQLRTAGYETLSLHAATGMMYDRIYWYPRVGFDRSVFFESRFWPRRCYSFPGGCDADMFDELHSFFQEPGKRFLYWLTLNSHAPYDVRDIRNDRFDCAEFEIESSSEVCRNLKLQAQFFEGLASALDQEMMRDVQVIVVGDHEPVIMNVAEKNKYFVSGRVPWVYLK